MVIVQYDGDISTTISSKEEWSAKINSLKHRISDLCFTTNRDLFETVVPELSSLSSLRGVEMFLFDEFGFNEARALKEQLPKLSKPLETLGLFDIAEMSPEVFHYLLNEASILLHLSEFAIRLCPLGIECMEHLGQVMAAKHLSLRLEKLTLETNQLGCQGVQALAIGLCHTNNLSTLDLRDNDIGDEGIQYLCQALKRNYNNNLKNLSLRGNSFTLIGAKAIAEYIPSSNALQSLDLGTNQLGNDGVSAIVSELPKISHLQTLLLDHVNMGDEGLIALAESLKYNTGLVKLELRNNHGITIDGYDRLGMVLCNYNKSLTEITIRRFDIISNLDKLNFYLELNKWGREKFCNQQFPSALIPNILHLKNNWPSGIFWFLTSFPTARV